MKRQAMICVLFIIPVLLFGQNLGLGAIVGSPTGLSFKYALAKQSALAAHAGWSFIGDKGIHLTGDYQYLFPMVIETAEGTEISDFTPYVAAGGRFRFKKDEETDDNEFHLGIRIGGGVEYLITRFGIFLEVVPVVDVIPSTTFDLEGGVGFLFYF
jgi:hypothetical protein